MSPSVNSESERGVEIYKGVTYAERDDGELKLDLFVPTVEDPPLVVYVHGGGWIAETRDNVPEPEQYAAEWGYAIASVGYRLSEVPDDSMSSLPIDPENDLPRGVLPDQILDVKAAIRWLRANADTYGYDAKRVAAWGASAGGHLASLAGVLDNVSDLAGEAYSAAELTKTVAPEESGEIQAVVDWYGSTDLTRFNNDRGIATISRLVGGPKAENRAKVEAASPVNYVSPGNPPFLFMHGREDQLCPVEQSRLMFDKLDEAGVNAVLYELHDLGHVFARGGPENIESERVAIDLLEADPTPSQSLYEVSHVDKGRSAIPLVEGKPPAGPDAIEQFLDNTIA